MSLSVYFFSVIFIVVVHVPTLATNSINTYLLTKPERRSVEPTYLRGDDSAFT